MKDKYHLMEKNENTMKNNIYEKIRALKKKKKLKTTTVSLLSDSGMLEVMDELVDVSVLTDGGRPGNSPVRNDTSLINSHFYTTKKKQLY